MATAYGLTPAGFVRKRAEQIRESLRGSMRQALGADIDLSSKSALSRLIDPFAAELDLAWQAAEGAVQASDVQAAQMVPLENLLRPLVGERLGATATLVVATVTAEEGTTYPEGTLFRSTVLELTFESTDEVVVGASGAATIPLAAVTLGALSVPVGTVDELLAFVPGHLTVTNASAGTPGRDVETDSEYRARAASQRRARTQRLEDSIEARLLALDAIQYARLLSNRGNAASDVWTNPTTGAPLDPGQMAALIYPELTDVDDLDAIAEILWREQGMGQYAGDQARGILQANGRAYDVRWSWVEDLDLYVHAIILAGADAPTDIADQIRVRLVSRGNELGPGDDVIVYRLQATGDEFRGVNGLAVTVGPDPNPASSDNVVVSSTQIARFDLSRATATVVTS